MRRLNFPPNVEIFGMTIQAFIENLQGEDTAPIVHKYGLHLLEPNTWHPVDNLLKAFNEIYEGPNGSTNMVAIGLRIGETIPLQPEIDSLPDALMDWNRLYQSLHRNADVGLIVCEKVSDTHYKITLTDLYPDDFSYGIVYGYARRFLPKSTPYRVYYDPDEPNRNEGGERSIIHVTW